MNRPSALIPLVAQAMLFAATLELPAQPQAGTVLWRFDLGSPIRSSPALGPDGTVYVGTAGGALCAVTNSGGAASNKWSFAAAIDYSSPVVASDGTVYLASGDGNLYAIKPDGSLKWSFAAACGNGSPAIARDGTVYVQGYAYLFAVTASGDMKWKAQPGSGGNSSTPAIGHDGAVYIGDKEFSKFYAFAPDGTQKWSRDLYTLLSDAPAIAGDGTIYVAGGPLYAFAPDGTTVWTVGSGSFFDGLPVLGKDATIYVSAAASHILYAVSPGGDVIWQNLSAGLHAPNAAALDIAGNIYYSATNNLVALTPGGLVKWTVYGGFGVPPGIDGAATSPLVGPDGTIYAAIGTTLFAISSGTNAPANSAWPMYQQNSRHTGKIENPSLKPQKRSDAGFEFQLYGQLGQGYKIEGSTNFSTWTSITSFVATTLPMDLVDASASNSAAKFYRAVASP